MALIALPKQKAGRRTRISMSPFAVLSVLFSCLGGICVHAAKEAVASNKFSVQLHRQSIPLFSDAGVIYYRSAYFGEIAVGAPQAQKFNVVFDTGSGHLVLPSTLCRSKTCSQHRRYKRRASVMAKDIDADGTPVARKQARDQISVSFGTGEITGIFVEDQVCFGDSLFSRSDVQTHGASMLQIGREQISKQPLPLEESVEVKPEEREKGSCFKLRLVAAMDMTEEPFADFEFDGVLGLGLTGLSQTPEFNFANVAGQAGALGTSDGPQIFSVFLGYSNLEKSEITFGGWQTEHLEDGENMTWCTVHEPQLGYWQLQVFSLVANGKVIDFCAQGCRAIVDTGSSLVAVPTAMRAELWQALVHDADADGNCNGTEPTLEVDLGNFTVTLRPEDYSHPDPPDVSDHHNDSAEGTTHDAGVEHATSEANDPLRCVPMLMNLDLPDPLGPKTLILGEPVLQRYYTAFDSALHRIGFGKAKHVVPQQITAEQDRTLEEEIV